MKDLLNIFDVNIKYYEKLNLLIIKCVNVTEQLEDLKKILKILAFKIQSKLIKKDSIILEFTNKDFIKDEVMILLDILRFTKTSHYFNIIVRNENINQEILNDRIAYINEKYIGLNINKKMKFYKQEDYIMKGYKILNFDIHSDDRGDLTSLSDCQEIPFEIKRIYYTWNMPKDAIRGGHAHKKLNEVMVCLHGSCDFVLDDGKRKLTVTLNKPNKGLYIDARLWREFRNFSEDCVVILIASDYYDPNDYIRDYNEFLTLQNNISND